MNLKACLKFCIYVMVIIRSWLLSKPWKQTYVCVYWPFSVIRQSLHSCVCCSTPAYIHTSHVITALTNHWQNLITMETRTSTTCDLEFLKWSHDFIFTIFALLSQSTDVSRKISHFTHFTSMRLVTSDGRCIQSLGLIKKWQHKK